MLFQLVDSIHTLCRIFVRKNPFCFLSSVKLHFELSETMFFVAVESTKFSLMASLSNRIGMGISSPENATPMLLHLRCYKFPVEAQWGSGWNTKTLPQKKVQFLFTKVFVFALKVSFRLYRNLKEGTKTVIKKNCDSVWRYRFRTQLTFLCNVLSVCICCCSRNLKILVIFNVIVLK